MPSECQFVIPDLLVEEAIEVFQQLVKAVGGTKVSLVRHGLGHPLAVGCLALPQRTTTCYVLTRHWLRGLSAPNVS